MYDTYLGDTIYKTIYNMTILFPGKGRILNDSELTAEWGKHKCLQKGCTSIKGSIWGEISEYTESEPSITQSHVRRNE